METQNDAQTTAKLSQKEAVFNFITEAIAAEGKTRLEGSKLRDYVTPAVRKVVRQRLFAGFRAGEIGMKKVKDDNALKRYCSGVITNFVKKDPRFN